MFVATITTPRTCFDVKFQRGECVEADAGFEWCIGREKQDLLGYFYSMGWKIKGHGGAVRFRSSLEIAFSNQDGLCFYCGQRMTPLSDARPYNNRQLDATLDHKIPKHMGGTRGNGNAVAACNRCNNHKGPLTHVVYLMVRHEPRLLKQVRIQVNNEAAGRQLAATPEQRLGVRWRKVFSTVAERESALANELREWARANGVEIVE
jgi:hypothetical protein